MTENEKTSEHAHFLALKKKNAKLHKRADELEEMLLDLYGKIKKLKIEDRKEKAYCVGETV
eukprot:12245615-Ditylum_brightwellii.AAC.1